MSTVTMEARRPELVITLYAPITFLCAAIAGLLCSDILAFTAVIVLGIGWRMLRQPDGPPVLRFVFLYQWLQVSIGVLYFGATGRYSETMARSDYRTMVYVGLASVGALFAGIAFSMFVGRLLGRRRAPRARLLMTNRDLVILYLVSLFAAGTLLQVGRFMPGLFQAAIVLTYLRYGFLYLAFYRLSQPRFVARIFIPLLAFEILLGFTGFFADFREPIIFAALALLQGYDIRKVRHTVILGAVAILATAFAVVWTAIKPEARSEYGQDATSRLERVTLIRILTSRFAADAPTVMMESVDMTVDRLWTVYYPALALERVPEVIAHTNGAFMWGGIRHILTPRIIFPDKPALVSNSEKVREYTGLFVAGEEEGTSIAFGYSAELYIDYGVPNMLFPLVLFGILMLAAVAGVGRAIRHQDISIAVTTCIIWFSLYQFEQSWARMLGMSLTLLIVLGVVGIIIDRYLARRHARGSFPALPS